MEHRFVSALGPDRLPAEGSLDVRYFEATPPEFQSALDAKARLDTDLVATGRTTVIYRLSYDRPNDEFYWSRQIDLRPGGGEEKYAGEPADLGALSYELFAIPVSVLSQGQEFALASEVREIYERSNSSKPGNGHP